MRRIVIGIGNPDRGDDAAGRMVARELRLLSPPEVSIAECNGEATLLLSLLEDRDVAVVVDACSSGRPPGTIQRFDVQAGPLPELHSGLSTHGFGPAAAIELARSLSQLPAQCLVYAIEGAGFTAGDPLSPAVAAAVHDVLPRIVADLAIDGAGQTENPECTKRR